VAFIRSETSQRRGRGSVVATLAALAALALAAPAAAAPIADEAAVVYDPHAVAVIDLTLSPEAIAALEAEPDEYVKGTFAMATTSGGPGGEETALTASPHPVEVRLKGSGSFRPITGEAAFKLKFKKVDAFLGLRKMTLNNMVQDESMAHEALTYLAFGASMPRRRARATPICASTAKTSVSMPTLRTSTKSLWKSASAPSQTRHSISTRGRAATMCWKERRTASRWTRATKKTGPTSKR
jgi:hypothetical protein